jgi:VWFA-related protein
MVFLLMALLLPASPPAEVRSITLFVTDEKGGAVEGLAPEEVAVLENGVARELTRLEVDRRPLTVAVLVDTSAPMASAYRLNLVEAVTRFLGRLPEGSRFALWTTGDRPTKVVDYTTDVAQASRALKRVFPTGGNTLLDALVEASRDLKRREGQRTAVVAVTGAGIGFSSLDRQRAVDLARDEADVFMAVQFDETGDPETRAAGPGQVGRFDYDFVLAHLTGRSGGVHERPLSAMAVAAALQKVAAALRSQYRLSYATSPELKERKVEVKLARPGARVRVGPPRP